METVIHFDYRAKSFKSHTGDMVWWVVCSGGGMKELKICSVPHWIRYQQVVAETIADSLNRNKRRALVDLI